MNLAQFLLILRARSKVIGITFAVVVLTTLVVSLLMPKSYTATTTLVLNYKGVDPVTGLSIPAQLMPGYMATQTDIITSRNVAIKVVDQLKFAENPIAKQQFMDATGGKGDIKAWLGNLLLRKLDVKPSRESSVLEISFTGNDPEFAAAVANAFATAYQQVNLQLKVDPAIKAAEFLGDQTKVLRENLEAAQARLSKYQQEKGLTGVMEHMDVETSRLNDLATQLVMAQSQSYEASSRQVTGNSDTSPDVAANPVVQNLRIDIARSESKLSDLSQRLGTSHPQYLSAKAELDKLKGQLAEEAAKTSSTIGSSARIQKQREAQLRAELAEQKKRVLELNRARDEFSVLQRDVENAQRALDTASQRLTQTSLEGNANQSEVAVLNPATPPDRPSSPKLLLNMMLSVFLGTMLGLGFGLLSEMLDRRIRSRSDVSDLLGIPVFAVIESGKAIKSGKRIFGFAR